MESYSDKAQLCKSYKILQQSYPLFWPSINIGSMVSFGWQFTSMRRPLVKSANSTEFFTIQAHPFLRRWILIIDKKSQSMQVNQLRSRKSPLKWSIMYLRKSLTKFCPTLRLCLIVRIRFLPHRRFDGSPDDQHGIYAFIYVRNERYHACDTRTVKSSAVFCLSRIRNSAQH